MASGHIRSNNLAWYAVLGKTTLTTSYVTKDTYLNRKFSDYEILIFEFFYDDWIVGSATVERSNFMNSTGVTVVCHYGTSTDVEYDIKPVNDTSVQVKKITSASGAIKCRILGLIVE